MDYDGLIAIDGSGSEAERNAIAEIRARHGASYVDVLKELYHSSKSRKIRAACIYYCFGQAKSNKSATSLALEALADKSKIVRFRACQLLAYSLNQDILPQLKLTRSTISKDSVEDVDAVVDAIQSQNQNFFRDRTHSGKIFMTLRESDDALR
jgi:hypothetical protein